MQYFLTTESISVHNSIFDKYIHQLVDKVKEIGIGEPDDSNTIIGKITDHSIYKKSSHLLEKLNTNFHYNGRHTD